MSRHEALEPKLADKRASRRYKVFLLSEVAAGPHARRAHALNVSRTGALLHVGAALEIGSTHTLSINAQSTPGTVIWSDDKRAGIAFTRHLSLDHLEKLVYFDGGSPPP